MLLWYIYNCVESNPMRIRRARIARVILIQAIRIFSFYCIVLLRLSFDNGWSGEEMTKFKNVEYHRHYHNVKEFLAIIKWVGLTKDSKNLFFQHTRRLHFLFISFECDRRQVVSFLKMLKYFIKVSLFLE